MNEYHINNTPELHIRKFDGFLGPMWGIILYVIESRRVVKEYIAMQKVIKAESDAKAAEFEQCKKIAAQKAEEIRKNCAANVHYVERWKTGDGWRETSRFTGSTISEWYNMHGMCKYCNSPVTKRAYTVPNN